MDDGSVTSSALIPAAVRLRRSSLDARIERGDDVASDELLARRAHDLQALETRRRYGHALLGVLDRGEHHGAELTAALPVQVKATRRAHDELVQLAVALLSPEPVRARGVLLARELLCDSASPLFAPSKPGALRRAASQALEALRPPPAPTVGS